MGKKRRTEPDTRRLIGELLTRICMIMEDGSVTALLSGSLRGSLRDRIGELDNSAASNAAIVKAARVLLND